MARPLGKYPFPLTNKAGVYRIDNTESGAVYIGSAIDFYRRWRRHHNELNKGVHGNQHLQQAWNLYGSSAFVWSVVEEVEPLREVLLTREQYWLDHLREEGVDLYNTCRIAGSHLGVTRSAETRERMSQKARLRGDNGMIRDEEWSRKVSAANRANAKTRCGPEFRAKMVKIHKGNTHTKGLKYLHKAGVNKGVHPEDTALYLADGWVLGRV